MSESMKTLAGAFAQRVAVRFVYQVSRFVPAEDRRRMYAQVQTIIVHEIERLVMEMQNQKEGEQ